MKKIFTTLCAALLVLGLTACSGEPEHTVVYEKAERMEVAEQFDCIAVYTQYTNGSSESAVELPPIVPTGERTNGYIQCDASVQSGVTADVVWFFELDDDSAVSLEIPGAETVEIPLTEEQ